MAADSRFIRDIELNNIKMGGVSIFASQIGICIVISSSQKIPYAKISPFERIGSTGCLITPKCGDWLMQKVIVCEKPQNSNSFIVFLMKTKWVIICLLLLALLPVTSNGRDTDVALKTNLLYDAALTPNAGVEVSVAPRWSADLSGNFNAWTLSGGKRWKHWLLQPEMRYWFCDAMGGHFVAVHLLGGQYNIGALDMGFSFLGTDFSKLRDSRYQGWFAGVGIAYGYAWRLARHWNIEAEIGIGWTYTRYDRYPCAECGSRLEKNHPHNYVGPTKAAVNLVYVF